MMLKQVITAIAVVALGLVSAQDAPSACAASCVNGVFANAASVGCANGDMVCVCNQPQSFQDGIRDCITAACPGDVPDVQIPLADAYGNDICAKVVANNAPASTIATEAPPSEPTSTTAEPTSTPTTAASTTTSVSSVEPTSQTTAPSPEVANTATSSPTTSSLVASSSAASPSAADNQPTTVPTLSSTTSASLSSTTSSMSQPTTTSSATTAASGTSTAVKAGIGAGVGAAALAAVIIAVCACLRRRQRNKTANRVRKYKISEPMSSTGGQFADSIGRAESGLPKPIITRHPAYVDRASLPTSPTSVYSNSSELEAHARRYEDMVPRTQPRTMI
ncbi:hypothetical protein O1611_g4166 [Lasiodiplodia mahajangana]|uniref:Uncharacterized protein n=1 Tax=Lasiodiplodia mahajangana TaxID=1108764 RepID=A0ACC2JQ07_9PEZI|nr:hypothetical protein O1611_g4166 [Lasiodiplodia mahajangana]